MGVSRSDGEFILSEGGSYFLFWPCASTQAANKFQPPSIYNTYLSLWKTFQSFSIRNTAAVQSLFFLLQKYNLDLKSF